MGNCQDNIKILDQLGTEEGQSHLMNQWQNLPSSDKRKNFQDQLNKVNVNKVLKIYKKSSHYSLSKSGELASSTQTDRTSSSGEFYPIPESKIIRKEKILEQKEELESIGLQAIKNGEVAVFIMAGNQNPQLNLEFPLGIYDIGLDSACSIFQIMVRKLSRLQVISGASDSKRIKLYIMTNTQNKGQVKKYFKTKNYFGYGQNNVFFFSQTLEPTVDENGKIVLKSEGSIYMSPRGNGMIYKEIKQKNLLSHLDNFGIKYIFIGPINNVLLKIADPSMFGYLIRQKKQIVATCLQSKDQCMGYFGLTSDLKHIKVFEERTPNPNKKWANSGSCFMTVDFLAKIISNIKFMDEIEQNFNDVIREIAVYNAKLNKKFLTKCLHFQSFYHKAFELTDNIAIAQIDPIYEFSPIKNNEKGKYSITSARDAFWNWNKLLLTRAGVTFQGKGHVEIHPALTYEGENITDILAQKRIKNILKLPQFIY